jgi:subtilisin family serine protease
MTPDRFSKICDNVKKYSVLKGEHFMNIFRSKKTIAWLGVGILLTAIAIFPAGLSSLAGYSDQAAGNNPTEEATFFNQPTNQVIVKYKSLGLQSDAVSPMSSVQLERLSEAAGVSVTYFREMSGDAHVLRLPERLPLEQVQAISENLMQLPEVEYAEPDAIMYPMLTPNDPQYTNQWHYFAPSAGNYGINAPAAWDITTGSASIVAAVIDTGITNHSEFSGRTVPGYDFISDTFISNDSDGRDNNPSDPGDWAAANYCYAGSPAEDSSWHGTHTAGTIGAGSNNGAGVTGINWNSKILPIRVLGKCGGTTSDIVDGMRWAAGLSVSGVPANANPAKVMNLSLGGSGSCSATWQNAITAINGAGATVVVSAGNSNANASGYTPASCSGVITIAATNRNGSRAYYSNYGTTVEISAPGGETIISTNGVLSTLNTGTQGPVADTYEYYQGTSMSAPHVTGVVSLLYSLSPSLTPAQVLSIIQNTATAFPGGSTCNTTNCGTGIVNAGNAVAIPPRVSSLNPNTAAAGSGALTLHVLGGNFINGATILVNGSARTTSFVSSSELTTLLSVSDLSVSTTLNISVRKTDVTYGTLTTESLPFTVGGGSLDYPAYLPLVMNRWPPVPYTPVLNPIDNSGGDDFYDVCWNTAQLATSYTLQEDEDAAFGSPTARYTGSSTCKSIFSQPYGTFYYRVKATNSYGESNWSNTQTVTVRPPQSNVYVDNGTGETLYFEVYGTGIGEKSFSPGEYFYGSFDAGTYTYHASGWCGTLTEEYYYYTGTVTQYFYCSSYTAQREEGSLRVR